MSQKLANTAFWCVVVFFSGVLIAADLTTLKDVAGWIFGPNGAACVQAIGSVGAILVAIYVMRQQSEAALQLRAQTTSDNEIMACVRALLACQGHLTGLRSYKVRTIDNAIGPARHFRFASGGTVKVLVPMDLDSLAFLAVRGGMDVLEVFSQINTAVWEFSILREGLVEFSRRAVDPPLEKLFQSTGRPLQPSDMVNTVGIGANSELLARIRDLEQTTLEDITRLPPAMLYARARILEIYPNAILPDATASVVPGGVSSVCVR
jgi:hypothetical protein